MDIRKIGRNENGNTRRRITRTKTKERKKILKDNFFKNITKNNLNNSLEQVLSKKSFSVETKNILLSMFYKIENGYNDYKTVKRDTYEKKVYIQKLIDIINKDCEKIEFLKQNDKSKEVVNKEKKEIICYPIETQILYLLAKIQKKNVIVKYIDYYLEKAFSFVLNTGNETYLHHVPKTPPFPLAIFEASTFILAPALWVAPIWKCKYFVLI